MGTKRNKREACIRVLRIFAVLLPGIWDTRSIQYSIALNTLEGESGRTFF